MVGLGVFALWMFDALLGLVPLTAVLDHTGVSLLSYVNHQMLKLSFSSKFIFEVSRMYLRQLTPKKSFKKPFEVQAHNFIFLEYIFWRISLRKQKKKYSD